MKGHIPGMQAPPEAERGKEMDSLPEPPDGMQPCLKLDFSSENSISDF